MKNKTVCDVATLSYDRLCGKMRGYVSDFLDLFYPRLCIGCGKNLYRQERDLCLSCMLQLPLMRDNCNVPNFIEERFYGRAKIEDAVALLYFEKETLSQAILHELKYYGNKELGRRFGYMLGAKMQKEHFYEVDALIPVPLHKNKLRSRGYNQSEWIAKGISEAIQKPILTNVLERVVENPTQTKMGATDRWENVKGIFQLKNSSSIDGLRVLIVDDVLTTGATIEACIAPLQSENVKICVAALAAVY